VGGGTFAVGARHMHRFEVVVRIVQELEQLDGVVEISLVGSGSNALVHWELVEHPVESFLVGHI
jgi:CTP synthase (UTP-ammonia lyase)